MTHHAYICFAEADEKFRDALVTHLSALITSGKLVVKDASTIGFVDRPEDERLAALDDADLIFLLLSARFLKPDPVRDREIERAMERNQTEQIPIIPIRLSDCDIDDTPLQGRHMLPANRALGSPANDQGWSEITKEVRNVLRTLSVRSRNASREREPDARQLSLERAPDTRQQSRELATATLSHDELRALANAAIECGLERSALVSGIPRALLAANQAITTTVTAGILSDLNVLNGLDQLPSGDLPLEIWLNNAILLSPYRREQGQFKKALGRLRTVQAGAPLLQTPSPTEPQGRPNPQQQEAGGTSPRAGERPIEAPHRGLDLKGNQVDLLCRALENAFPTVQQLKRMMRVKLELKLDTNWHSPGDAAFDLVTWAEENGRIDDLLHGALASDPGNEHLQRFANEVMLTSDSGPSEDLFRKLESIVLKGVKFAHSTEWRTTMAMAERTVCRIESSGVSGTGFLVGPRLVMTNFHVAHALQSRPARFLFDFKLNVENKYGKGPRVVTTTSMQPKAASAVKDLDYAILELPEAVGEELITEDGSKRGFLRPVPHVFQPPEPLIILQHPAGDLLKVCAGSVLGMRPDPSRVTYAVNTIVGSSGSPVFTFAWELAALHRAGADDGNEGVPMAAILADLKAQDMIHLLDADGSVGAV